MYVYPQHKDADGKWSCDYGYGGLMLRDYFAAQALIGLIINPATVSVHVPITERAYELADAMMARREQ